MRWDGYTCARGGARIFGGRCRRMIGGFSRGRGGLVEVVCKGCGRGGRGVVR